jgi:hypothetical protein
MRISRKYIIVSMFLVLTVLGLLVAGPAGGDPTGVKKPPSTAPALAGASKTLNDAINIQIGKVMAATTTTTTAPPVTTTTVPVPVTTTTVPAPSGPMFPADSPISALPSDVQARALCIRNRESHGDYQAQNPSSTASGAWQFLDSSWLAYGGGQFAPRAWMASPYQQDQVFVWAYQQSGLNPWAGGGYSC